MLYKTTYTNNINGSIKIIKTEGIEKYIDKGYYNMYNLKNDDEYDNEYDDEYYDHICIIRCTMSYDK